jgi:hypothetical protein
MTTVQKPKKRVNSKSKGNGFESKIAKMLSTKFAPMKFVRTPGSGARVGGQNFGALGQFFSDDALKLFVGDVVPVNEKDCPKNFKFVIECKFYKDAEKIDGLLSGSSNIYKWVDVVLDDCKKVDKLGLAVFKWNNTPIYAAVTKDVGLPAEIARIILTNGIQVVYFDELLKFDDFWLNTEIKGG